MRSSPGGTCYPYDVGFSLNYRFQSGFPYAPIVPDGAVALNVCNFGCAFFATNLDQNRSESVNLMNLRVDKSIGVGRTKASLIFDVYNVLNADPVTNFNLNAGAGYRASSLFSIRGYFRSGFGWSFDPATPVPPKMS